MTKISASAAHLHALVEERRGGARTALYMKRNVEASLALPGGDPPGDPAAVVGYVNVKDLVIASHEAAPARVGDIARPILSLGADLPVAECLERLMSERSHLALVRDTHDAVVGLVTLEDIIELLVGEMGD